MTLKWQKFKPLFLFFLKFYHIFPFILEKVVPWYKCEGVETRYRKLVLSSNVSTQNGTKVFEFGNQCLYTLGCLIDITVTL